MGFVVGLTGSADRDLSNDGVTVDIVCDITRLPVRFQLCARVPKKRVAPLIQPASYTASILLANLHDVLTVEEQGLAEASHWLAPKLKCLLAVELES